MTDKFAPEEERAYECGYKDCCHNNNISYVHARRTWNNMMRIEVELSDKTLNTVSIDVIAKDIAHQVVTEYKRLKKKAHPPIIHQPSECRNFRPYAQWPITTVKECDCGWSKCLLKDSSKCPDFKPKIKQEE